MPQRVRARRAARSTAPRRPRTSEGRPRHAPARDRLRSPRSRRSPTAARRESGFGAQRTHRSARPSRRRRLRCGARATRARLRAAPCLRAPRVPARARARPARLRRLDARSAIVTSIPCSRSRFKPYGQASGTSPRSCSWLQRWDRACGRIRDARVSRHPCSRAGRHFPLLCQDRARLSSSPSAGATQ